MAIFFTILFLSFCRKGKNMFEIYSSSQFPNNPYKERIGFKYDTNNCNDEKDKNKKVYTDMWNDNVKVHFKDGCAYTEEGHPYTGEFLYKNSSDDVYNIFYYGGKLSNVNKNGEFYKGYSDDSEHIGCRNLNRKLKDGVTIPYRQMYKVEPGNTKIINDYETGKVHCIIKKNNKDNRPDFFSHLLVEIKDGSIPTATDIEEIYSIDNMFDVEFESVEHANEYFMEKYGIDAEFKNLSQAVLFKSAVDRFIPLEFNKKGERLFEGLKIRNNPDICDDIAARFVAEKKDENTLLQILKEHKKFSADSIYDLSIEINPNVEPRKEKEYFTGLQSEKNGIDDYAGKYFDNEFTHELGHYLHFMNCYLNGFPKDSAEALPSLAELKVRLSVSEYAATSPSEFVAEYINGRLDGKTYSKEADELYKKYNGPDLFN